MGDILGHERVVAQLWDALARDALHHAYLFEGPPGVGKHLVARRLAMAANCDGPEPRPCGVCGACRSIESGSHPDVIDLGPSPDKATPVIAVDQVREVVRQVGYHRYAARRRFVIVDPAESMAAGAANALLKTLEEPPDGTGFILIVHQSGSLLPTIVSRCQRVRFSAVPQDALAAWLAAKGVARPEDVSRLAMGCPGRALSLDPARLDERAELRDSLGGLVQSELGVIFKWSEGVCAKGSRADWAPRVHGVIDQVEEMLRDAVVSGLGHGVPLLDPDGQPIADEWGRRLSNTGVEACLLALAEARSSMDRNVAGKTVLDTLVARVATELGYMGP